MRLITCFLTVLHITNHAFNHTNIAQSLLIYMEPDPLDLRLRRLAPPKKHISDSAIIDETSFFKELVMTIALDNLFVTHKQAKEIISFFKRIAELALKFKSGHHLLIPMKYVFYFHEGVFEFKRFCVRLRH